MKELELYKNVLSGLDLGKVCLPNRLVLSPINTGLTDCNSVSEELIDFHRQIAAGGIGMSIIGCTAVRPDGIVNPNTLCLDSDEKIVDFKRLSASIRREGSVSAIQLNHVGRKIDDELYDIEPVSASAIRDSKCLRTPKELNVSEIHEIVDDFGSAARRAVDAGIQVIELHCAHGYLIHQFLSPLSNHRTDAYGGSLFNRAKFCLDIVKSVRYAIGENIPIICRISIDDFVRGGMHFEEMRKVVSSLEQEGVDAIDVSAGISSEHIVPNYNRLKILGEFTTELKKQLRIPVIIVGNVMSLMTAERLISSRSADLVALGRALIADPLFIRKTLAGREDQIVGCTECDECHYRQNGREHISCSQNEQFEIYRSDRASQRQLAC